MSEILGHKIDINGMYIEDVFVDPNNIPSDVIIPNWQPPLIKPKWNGSSWIEGETQENILSELKKNKLAELDNKCNATIMGGFQSSALGAAHTYQSLIIDEIWFNSTLHRFAIDPNFTSVQYKTVDAGYLPHTKEQFIQVFVDGHSFGDSQIAKLNNLKTQVDAVQSQADLDAITW